jgi:hypothetical protein
MNCEQFQNEIERTIDERSSSAPVSANLAGHADSCEACRSVWQDFLLLESALASWTEPVEIDLVDRVVAAALKDESPETSSNAEQYTATLHRRTWWTVATVAAVLLGAAFVFQSGPDQTADDDSPVPAPGDTPFNPELNEDDQYAGVDELLASTRSAWEGIASKAVNQANGLSVFVPDLNSDLGLPGSDSPSDTEGASPGESPEEGSLIPGEVDRAFDFLLDVSSDVTTT